MWMPRVKIKINSFVENLHHKKTYELKGQTLKERLNKIDFVGKIIFGKWHYNKKISEYKELKKFYNRCADYVENFCQEKDIQGHKKNKTKSWK